MVSKPVHSSIDSLSIFLGSKIDRSLPALSQPSSLMDESIPLLPELRGTDKYLRRLGDAAREMYALLKQSSDVQQYAQSGLPVEINEKERGIIPPFTNGRQAKTVRALEHILHSLAYIGSNPQVTDTSKKKTHLRTIGVPISPTQYVEGRYAHLEFKSMTQSIYGLAVLDRGNDMHGPWIEYIPGRFNRNEKVGLRTRIGPKIKLLDWLIQRELIFTGHPEPKLPKNSKTKQPLLRVRDEDDDSKYAPLSRPLSASEEILPLLNEQLSRQRLSIKWPDYAAYERNWDYSEARSKVHLTKRKTLYRQFVGRDGIGGRLSGHCVQSLPRHVRKQYLRIDGSPVDEADFSSIQLKLLYVLNGLESPEGDLYAGINYAPRELMKIALTRSVGCRTRNETVSSIAKELQEQNLTAEYDAALLYDSLWARHAQVCPHGEGEPTAAWGRLQFLESELALLTLRKLLDVGVVAIPIHDSFVVPAQHIETVRRMMDEAFEQTAHHGSPRIESKFP
jgi:hypothetical protein